MVRPALRTATVQRCATPTAKHGVWEAVWRLQFNTSKRPLSTSPLRALNKNTGASQFTTRRTRTHSWSWMTARLEKVFRASRRGSRSSARNRNPADAMSAQDSLSLTQRLKKLSKEYGWSAVGVYFALSVLDFPFCFLLVRVVGTDRIGQLEDWVMFNIKKLIPESVKNWWHEYRAALRKSEAEQHGNDDISDAVEMAGWGVEEAQARNQAEASLGTQLALAYAIHKSFIFLRVPLTAAVTPKVVKTLRSWGWQIGKRRSK